QLSRVAFEMKFVPPESHDEVFTASPLCSVVIVLICQPPANWFTTPPRARNFCPLPNGSVYKTDATNRCGMLKSDGPYSHDSGQRASCGENVLPTVPRMLLVSSNDFDHV